MLYKLFVFLALISIVSCAHKCTEDGLFPNPDDKTSYFECVGQQERFVRCSRSPDGRHYLVFDERLKQCVEPNAVAPGSRAVATSNFVCPQPTGLFRYLSDDRQYFECIENQPLLKQCPDGTIFDGLVCSQPTGPITAGEFVPAADRAFTCPKASGVFANPTDRYRYTYYECHNSVSTMRNCPSYMVYRDGQYLPDRMVFDGQSCVRPTREGEFIDNRRPVYEDRPSEFVDNRPPQRPLRQTVPEYRCGTMDGFFQSSVSSQTWYECEGGTAKRVYTCESGLTFDTVTRRCRGTQIRDEEVVVHRPETVPVESNPLVTELGQETGRFYPGQDYYGRRYRRNGRVEFEDQHTGSVIVDTWNEGAWRWDRDMNGRRLPLPLINDWQAYDYYRTRAGGFVRSGEPDVPAAEYRRPAEEYRRPAEEYRRPAEEYRRPAVAYVRPQYVEGYYGRYRR